jgi:hypothetical protein
MSLLKDVAGQVGKAVLTGAINKALGGFGEKGNEQGFNVQKMIGTLNKGGVAKTAHFEVQIVPPINKDFDTNVIEGLMYRVDTCDLPGRTMQTIDHRFLGTGPMSKVPYMAQYGDVSMSVIMSEDFREKEWFEIWHNMIQNTGTFEQGGSDVLGGRYSNAQFNNKYHSSYIGTVIIRQYGSAGELRSIHTLREAYPININPVTMNWGDDAVAKMTVGFAFRYYNAVFFKQDQPGLGAGFGFTIGKGGINGKINLPGFGSISRGPGGTSIDAGGISKRIAAAIL